MSGWIFSMTYSAVLSEIDGALEYSNHIPADDRALIETYVATAEYLRPGYSEYIGSGNKYDASYKKAIKLLKRARTLIPQDALQEVKLNQVQKNVPRQSRTGHETMTFLEWSGKKLG
jgi:hypothetical protein